MNRLLEISWRNIWRNRLRSLVVIIAVGLGVWSGVLMTALSYSVNEARKVKTIETQIGHVQIHHPDFVSEDDFNNYIDNVDVIQTNIANDTRVKARSYRSKSAAMISSPGYSAAVIINGVDPISENDFSKLGTLLVEGKYFEGIKRNPLLIGEKLAQKFKLKIRSKVVVTFIKGDIIEASSFRIAGIFKTGSGPYDEGNVFIRQSDIKKALGECEINEIGLMLHDIDDSEALKDELSSVYNHLVIRDWKLLAPELGYADEMMGKVLYIFMMIILLALGLGIVNTMLMAVMERQKEIGVLLAVGMNKPKVFFMIMFESIQLSVIGAPFGLFAAYISIILTGKYGIDLSVVADGLESFGVGAVLYPEINTEFYFVTAFMVIITAILSALYPAYKALKIMPANAIRGL